MNRSEKVQLAAELKQKFQKAQVAIFADYKGLTAPESDLLRKLVRAQNAEIKVLKNNVVRMAMKEGGFEASSQELLDRVVGPTCVAFAWGDPVLVAREMKQFAADHEAFTLKESLMGQRSLTVAQIEHLAELPSRSVLVAQLLGTLNAPVSNLLGVFHSVLRSLLNLLVAIEKKKTNAE